MKELISFFLIFLLFHSCKSGSFTNEDGLTINYNDYENGTKIVEVVFGKTCPFLYVWINEFKSTLRVRTPPLDNTSRDNEWNDIKIEHYQDKNKTPYENCPYCHEIGINTNGQDRIYFNFTREFLHNGDEFGWVTEEQIQSWASFRLMHCNNTNYWDYDENRDKDLKYRPGYHHTPFIGWMNDPNGLVYENMTSDGPYYHLFYQFNPYSSKWDNMHWGHSKTKDFLNWIHLPPAIYRFQKGHIFSGSVAFYKNRLYAFFTVFRKVEHNKEIKEFQHNFIAMNRITENELDLTTYYDILSYEPHEYGRIGRQFKNFTNPFLIPEEEKEFYDKNPGKTFEDYLDSPNFNSNYRDPKICLYKDDTNTTSFYVLLMSADYEYRIYQNKDPETNEKLDDLITWALVGKFGVGYGVETKYIQYECPDIVRIFPSGSSHAKWVFIANINPGCPFGGSATEYFTGDFDGATYTSDHVFPKWMDFGKDHYATVTYNNIPNEERVLGLPWSSNWIYAGTVPTTQYRSTNGLPREFTLFKVKGEFFLNVAPAREALKLRSSTRVPISETVSKKGKKKKL